MASVSELEKEFKKARKAFRADKKDASLKKAMRLAKKKLAEAKEAANGDVEMKEASPSVDLSSLEKAFKKARKAWRADKKNADLKKAFKKAKAEFEAAKESKENGNEEKAEEKTEESESVDLSELEAKVKAARKEFKKSKSKEAKKALKLARKALAAAKEANGDADMEVEEKTTAGKKRSREEAEEAEGEEDEKEQKEEKEDDGANAWAALSAKKKQKTESNGDSENIEASAKCFVGNLSFKIDEEITRDFFKDCGPIVDIFWLKDRETDRFKGCGFITFETKEAASSACAKAGQDLMGRPLKINFAKPRPGGDKPRKKSFGGGKGGTPRKPSERPEGGTRTAFVGNLSFDIDEDGMKTFAKECGQIQDFRWLNDRETGNFKGCGFLEFDSVEAVDKFIKLNGQDLMGRSIRIDYATSRN